MIRRLTNLVNRDVPRLRLDAVVDVVGRRYVQRRYGREKELRTGVSDGALGKEMGGGEGRAERNGRLLLVRRESR